jgi:quinol monooxygenase YgiN
MSYVVVAHWTAKPGEEAAVADLLAKIARASGDEPGCLLFWVHRSLEEPRAFMLYEQYVSEAAFEEHAASDHVRRFVLDDAVHRLDSRRREKYETIDPPEPADRRTDDAGA